jgi:hypothetical protein
VLRQLPCGVESKKFIYRDAWHDSSLDSVWKETDERGEDYPVKDFGKGSVAYTNQHLPFQVESTVFIV